MESPVKPPCVNCGAPFADHVRGQGCPRPPIKRHQRGSTETTLGVLGGLGIVGGAWAWLATNATANACHGLIAALAPDQCNTATTWHTLGAIAFVAGIALVIVAIVRSR